MFSLENGGPGVPGLHLGRLGERATGHTVRGAHIYPRSRFLPRHLAKDRGAGTGCFRQ